MAGKAAQKVTGSLSLEVDGDVAEVFKGNHSESVTSNAYFKADNIVIEGMTNVTIKVGSSYIAIEAGGITIGTSGTLELKSTGPMSATSNATLDLKATAPLTVKSDAQAQVSAPMTTVEGQGMLTLKGGAVMIN